MTKLRPIINCIIAAVVALVVAVGAVGSGTTYAAAESSGLMKELSTLTIDGKEFASEDYPADSEGAPQVLYLSEVGYNYYANRQGDYALYLYVYTPAQLDVADDDRNAVQMWIGNAERYIKYKLKLVERSADKLFYKFGVSFTLAEKSAVLAALDSESRYYEISSIELFTEGYNATDYPIAWGYTFSGYAAGCGELDGAAGTLESTLSYTIKGGTVPIPISVNHTSWRPEGTNGNTTWTQDTIHSVYFAVPNEYEEEYDYLKSVQAQWLEARLAPIYVTANRELAQALNEMFSFNLKIAELEQNGLSDEEQKRYSYGGMFNYSCSLNTSFDWYLLTWPKKANVFDIGEHDLFFGNDESYYAVHTRDGKNINRRLSDLSLFIYREGAADVQDFAVTANEISELIRGRQQDLETSFPKSTEYPVDDKYSALFFDSWDYDFTVKTIKIGTATDVEKKDETIVTSDKLILDSEQVKQNFWQKVFGGLTITNQQEYKGIEAIQKITHEDVDGKSTEQLSQSLYISERDAENFRTYFNNNQSTSTVYLMRFAISEYWRQPAYEYKKRSAGFWEEQSQGYFAQDTAYLDFDILDFEYVKDDESYIIPVSMSPIDIFPEITPPPELFKEDDFWKYGAGIIAGLIAVYVVYRVALTEIRKRRTY